MMGDERQDVTRIERFWRCASCSHELRDAPDPARTLEPRYGHAMTHACADGVVGVMHVVEREMIYASEAERRLIDTFESSDWALLAQAARRYCENRRRAALRNSPDVYSSMHALFFRLTALERACNAMAATAPPDSDINGGVGRVASYFRAGPSDQTDAVSPTSNPASG